MFEKYIATPHDLSIIEKALEFVWKPELDYIFFDRNRITKTAVISFDSENIYLWKRVNNKYELVKIPHKEDISDDMQIGWSAGSGRLGDLKPFVQQVLDIRRKSDQPVICGGLPTPFIELQKAANRKNNSYTTEESYLATIVHEFGHVFYDSFRKWYFYDKDQNINYLQTGLNLYEGESNIELSPIWLPENQSYMTELFAFCTDFEASKIFWPNHNNDVIVMNKARLSRLIKYENELDLLRQDSSLVAVHDYAACVGQIVMKKHGKDWSKVLTSQRCVL